MQISMISTVPSLSTLQKSSAAATTLSSVQKKPPADPGSGLPTSQVRTAPSATSLRDLLAATVANGNSVDNAGTSVNSVVSAYSEQAAAGGATPSVGSSGSEYDADRQAFTNKQQLLINGYAALQGRDLPGVMQDVLRA